MSTNTSQNLGLHLWEPTDQVLRTEFNQNWTKLDTAVNTAQETAEAAYSPDNMPYTVGNYAGNGDTKSIELGFRPSFLIIGSTNSGSINTNPMMYGAFTGTSIGTLLVITATGFTVTYFSSSSSQYPILNQNGFTYRYIAFE